MNGIVAALVPVLALIVTGYGLRRLAFLPDGAWAGIERLTYFVLFPALLIRTLGGQRLEGAPWPQVMAVVVPTVLAAAMLLLAWRRLRPATPGPTFTSVFQGGVRFNTYIALAVAQAYYGEAGLAMGALAAGFMIVLINLLCVTTLAAWGAGRGGPGRLVRLVRDVAGNPLIVACAIGWFLSLSGIGLPGLAADVLEVPRRAALPLGLLAVGAALRPAAVRGHAGHVTVASVVQFGVKPALAFALVSLTGLAGAAAGAVQIALMSPTAPSAYILAGQLGGDRETMASIITAQTVFAFPVMILLSGLLPG